MRQALRDVWYGFTHPGQTFRDPEAWKAWRLW